MSELKGVGRSCGLTQCALQKPPFPRKAAGEGGEILLEQKAQGQEVLRALSSDEVLGRWESQQQDCASIQSLRCSNTGAAVEQLLQDRKN